MILFRCRQLRVYYSTVLFETTYPELFMFYTMDEFLFKFC